MFRRYEHSKTTTASREILSDLNLRRATLAHRCNLLIQYLCRTGQVVEGFSCSDSRLTILSLPKIELLRVLVHVHLFDFIPNLGLRDQLVPYSAR